jgi:hypothetical protein
MEGRDQIPYLILYCPAVNKEIRVSTHGYYDLTAVQVEQELLYLLQNQLGITPSLYSTADTFLSVSTIVGLVLGGEDELEDFGAEKRQVTSGNKSKTALVLKVHTAAARNQQTGTRAGKDSQDDDTARSRDQNPGSKKGQGPTKQLAAEAPQLSQLVKELLWLWPCKKLEPGEQIVFGNGSLTIPDECGTVLMPMSLTEAAEEPWAEGMITFFKSLLRFACASARHKTTLSIERVWGVLRE